MRLPKGAFHLDDWETFMKQFDADDVNAKMTFNDFLSMMQRESFMRDTLAESMIFKQSWIRLSYNHECKLITLQHLKAMEKAKRLS